MPSKKNFLSDLVIKQVNLSVFMTILWLFSADCFFPKKICSKLTLRRIDTPWCIFDILSWFWVQSQWFLLVPLTRFWPILRKKSSGGRNFFLVRATAETKIVLKHKLPNADYRRCTRWLIQLELKKKYFSKPNLKKPKKN